MELYIYMCIYICIYILIIRLIVSNCTQYIFNHCGDILAEAELSVVN